jgi:hypothetical protein
VKRFAKIVSSRTTTGYEHLKIKDVHNMKVFEEFHKDLTFFIWTDRKINKNLDNCPFKSQITKFVDDFLNFSYTAYKEIYEAVDDEMLNKSHDPSSPLDLIAFDMKTLIMDIYCLARMFRFEKYWGDIIVYAGNYHSENYRIFMEKYLGINANVKIVENFERSCLKTDEMKKSSSLFVPVEHQKNSEEIEPYSRYNTQVLKNAIHHTVRISEDVLHKVGSPASLIFYDNGDLKEESWNFYGYLHKIDGPALKKYETTGKCVYEIWSVFGHKKEIREQYENLLKTTIYEDDKITGVQYTLDGVMHREDGPAAIYVKDGVVEQQIYVLNGEIYRSADFNPDGSVLKDEFF